MVNSCHDHLGLIPMEIYELLMVNRGESGKKYYYAPEKFHIVGEDICACKWED